MSTKIKVRCNQCGNEWDVRPQHLLRGHRCRICALKQRDCSKNTRKTTKQFMEEMKNKNPNISIIGEYTNAKTKVMCRCNICNHSWGARPTNLISGNGCPKCGAMAARDKQIKDSELFLNQLKVISPNIEIIGKYKGNKINIRCVCKKCGWIWEAMPANLLRGSGCPIHHISRGEKYIMNQLNNMNINYIFQKKFDGLIGLGARPLSFDFYLPEYNILIEYQGNFHDKTDRLQTDEDFKRQLAHDNLKRNYAIIHGYKILEIWYYDDINKKLNEIFNITNPVTTTAS